MNTSSVSFIKKTPNLHKHEITNRIIEFIVSDIKARPQYDVLRCSVDLVLDICNMIENLCYDNKLNTKAEVGCKMNIAKQVFQRLNWDKPSDIDFLTQSINYLWSTNAIVKVKWTKRVFGTIKHKILKNLV